MTPIKPITPEAKTLLEEFLSRPSHPEGTLSLGEVRGFLYAVTAAPDLVKPSEWLPMIFGGEEPGFETLEEAQQIMDVLMPLYNEINNEVRAKGPRLPTGCEFRDDLLANLEPDVPVSQWSRGFRNGHLWLEESWEEYLLEEWEEEFGAVLAGLVFFGSRSMAEAFAVEFTNSDASLESVAEKFRDLFPDAVAGYARMGMAIWETILEEREESPGPTVAEARIGRNEPCPCGSGKKYKKCCGASMH